jgi:hypothetical protein
MKIVNENDFKVKKLSEWGIKKYTLDEDRVDIKLDYIWIETKQKSEDIYEMLAQAIFTAHKVKEYKELPIYFGCFNAENGAIIENAQATDVFLHTDINWNQTPSKLDKKTVERIKFLLKEVPTFSLDDFGKKLKEIEAKGKLSKGEITKNNFLSIYQHWLEEVGRHINEVEGIKKEDCYLADLMTDGSKSIAEKLVVIYKEYTYRKRHEVANKTLFEEISIKDQKAYNNFWSKYNRPPKEEYQEYILQRRDLLRPSNIREEKGAFFTPQIWAEKSKDYLANAFGENWQDEYYIWDCACGTGNLEAGLVNQDRIFMSTLDEEDLNIMKQLNTMPDAVKFQFDFLNDDWKAVKDGGKLPNTLWEVIAKSPEKLIIYINPPYLEASNNKQVKGTGNARKGATESDIKEEMKKEGLGKASNELFAQFYFRIYKQIEGCKIGAFSTLKNCAGANFEGFRSFFKAKFCGGFVCRASTFDNVKGSFPISFQIWDCAIKESFPKNLEFDVLESETGERVGTKRVYNMVGKELLNDWFVSNNRNEEEILCYTQKKGNDFQNQNYIGLYNSFPNHGNKITSSNIIQGLIYVAVRLCIPATWLNDRDQFTSPTKINQNSGEIFTNSTQEYEYEKDESFINNCIVFSLFEKNNTNWELFPNSEIGVNGAERDLKIYNLLLKGKTFTDEANAVLEVARKIYRLYNGEFNNPRASWYEVCKTLKETKNITYGELRKEFLKAQESLAMEVALGVYKYGFLPSD